MNRYDAFSDEETPYRDERTLRELYVNQGMKMSEIADQLDCGTATVSRWIDKYGIEARSRAEVHKRLASKRPAHYTTNNKGREVWIDNTGGEYNMIQVHRLLAVAEYGFNAVVGKHIHHKRNIPWLNTPGNIELMDPSEHLIHHKTGSIAHEQITESDCRNIRERIDAEESVEQLAEEYDVQERTVYRHARANCHHER